MKDDVKPPACPYHAPRRAAATARTREAIVAVGKDAFERRGWSGASMRGVAGQAGVSVKTAEAPCRTKAEFLKQAVDYAIAGDFRPSRYTAVSGLPPWRPRPTRPPCSTSTPATPADRPVPPTPEGHVPTRAAQPANQHAELDDLQPRYL